MDYILDIPKAYPLLPWIRIFSSLSMSQFAQVYDFLDFPVFPDEPLRDLARNFSIAEELNRGNLVPENTSNNLFSEILEMGSYIERRNKLFWGIFDRLEGMGHAEAIYQWGRQTKDFQKPAYRDALAAWGRLLREWAIREWQEQPDHYGHDDNTNTREMIDKWISIYQSSYQFSPSSLKPLRLSPEALLKVYMIVMQQEQRRFNLEETLIRIGKSPKTAWEKFAFEKGAIGGVWLNLEGQFRINLREWTTLYNALSAEEMHQLVQWGLELRDTESSWKALAVPFSEG
jgi:hypothetical protein